MSYPLNTYRPNAMIGRDANNNAILPECFTAEALASRTDNQVAADDLALYVLVACTEGSYANSPGVGTTEQIEARHLTDSVGDRNFRKGLKMLKGIMEDGGKLWN